MYSRNEDNPVNPGIKLLPGDYAISVALKIDSKRIYAMDGSNGGMFTRRLAANMPDVFAAVAHNQSTIGGQLDSLSPVFKVQPTQPIPIIMVHGLDDRNVNYFGGKQNMGTELTFHQRICYLVGEQ